MPPIKEVNVFLATPGDLNPEREACRAFVKKLNEGFGEGANVQFNIRGWEDCSSSVGPRAQSVINKLIDEADVFILAMHRRWGQEAPDAYPCTSYTEEEFYRARWAYENAGAPRIFVFFKHVDEASLADPGVQLRKVLDFKIQLEQTRTVIHKSFHDSDEFCELVASHLEAYARKELPSADSIEESVLLPRPAIDEIERLKAAEAELAKKLAIELDNRAIAAGKLRRANIELAEFAVLLSSVGRITEAKTKFLELLEAANDHRILQLAFEFFFRIGDLSTARAVADKMLVSSGGDSDTLIKYYISSGAEYLARGEREMAEQDQRKALELAKSISYKRGIADASANVGELLRAKGDLREAEKLHLAALAIHRDMRDELAVIKDFSQLGAVYALGCEFQRANTHFRTALERCKTIKPNDRSIALFNRVEEQEAILWGQIGTLAYDVGNLQQATDACKKSLAINERINRLAGELHQHYMLGLISAGMGDIPAAKDHMDKALGLCRKVGDMKLATHIGDYIKLHCK